MIFKKAQRALCDVLREPPVLLWRSNANGYTPLMYKWTLPSASVYYLCHTIATDLISSWTFIHFIDKFYDNIWIIDIFTLCRSLIFIVYTYLFTLQMRNEEQIPMYIYVSLRNFITILKKKLKPFFFSKSLKSSGKCFQKTLNELYYIIFTATINSFNAHLCCWQHAHLVTIS